MIFVIIIFFNGHIPVDWDGEKSIGTLTKDSPNKENRPKQKIGEHGWGLPVTNELTVLFFFKGEAEPLSLCDLRDSVFSLFFCFLQQDTPHSDSLPTCSQNWRNASKAPAKWK